MISISVDHNEARLSGTLAHLDAGSGAAKIRVYTAPRPANGAAITTQTLLAEIVLDDPAGVVDDNKLTLTQADDVLFLASGTVSWARIVNANGDHNMDCDCSDMAGSGEIKFADDEVLAGGVAHMLAAEFG